MRFLLKLGLALCVILLIVLGLRHAGPALVVNQPQRSDVILLLAGDSDDIRYRKGIELLRAGYARQMLVDARVDAISYGRTPAELAEDFIRRSAGGPRRPCLPDQGLIHGAGDSVGGHLPAHGLGAQRPAGHLRLPHAARALGCGSVAAANHGLLSAPRWGTSREVAKDVFLEWQKLVWWELVDRHR